MCLVKIRISQARTILDLEVTPDNFSKLQDLKFNRKVSFELPSYTLVDISLVYYTFTHAYVFKKKRNL